MAPLHAKSLCCGAQVRRFGRRRRQCTLCKRTWRIRQKKRGRTCTRHTQVLLKRILIDGNTLLQEKRNFHGLRSVSIAARFAQALRAYVREPVSRLPQGAIHPHRRWCVFQIQTKGVGAVPHGTEAGTLTSYVLS